MPHPIYASQHWVCVVNPGEATLETVSITVTAQVTRFLSLPLPGSPGRSLSHD
jgi:hypothetical protein